MKKNITNRNSKHQLHGYQEFYYSDKMTCRVNYKNDKEIEYEEYHLIKEVTFYIK
jgi:hypothetical protein